MLNQRNDCQISFIAAFVCSRCIFIILSMGGKEGGGIFMTTKSIFYEYFIPIRRAFPCHTPYVAFVPTT